MPKATRLVPGRNVAVARPTWGPEFTPSATSWRVLPAVSGKSAPSGFSAAATAGEALAGAAALVVGGRAAAARQREQRGEAEQGQEGSAHPREGSGSRTCARRSGSERVERDADDLQPAREAAQREGEISSPLAPSASQSVPSRSGGVSDSATAGSSVAQRLAHGVAQRRVAADGLAQEPRAVADVALLVVVDLRVALDETGQQPLPLEVAR